MAGTPKRIYWDSCTWIALIQRERILGDDGSVLEDRGVLCRNIINAAFAGAFEIATCSLTLVEVCKDPKLKNPRTDHIADFFEHDFVLLVNIDMEVGLRARDLMRAGYSKLKPEDACQLAAAAISQAEEMHTFDDKLLALDGRIDKPDGTKLRICKPGEGGPPLPLLHVVAAG